MPRDVIPDERIEILARGRHQLDGQRHENGREIRHKMEMFLHFPLPFLLFQEVPCVQYGESGYAQRLGIVLPGLHPLHPGCPLPVPLQVFQIPAADLGGGSDRAKEQKRQESRPFNLPSRLPHHRSSPR